MTELLKSIAISSAGLRAQSERMRVVSENLANSDTLPQVPGGDPYRRKTVAFQNVLDRSQAINKVEIKRVGFDASEFTKRYDPKHPGADADGYVKLPNVSSLIEAMDMREAQRSYDANVGAIESARAMLMRTIGLLNGA